MGKSKQDATHKIEFRVEINTNRKDEQKNILRT